jgi:hypothetical protein
MAYRDRASNELFEFVRSAMLVHAEVISTFIQSARQLNTIHLESELSSSSKQSDVGSWFAMIAP